METSDLKQMPVIELVNRVEQLREEIFRLRCKAVTEPVTDPAGLRRKRKEVARIRTIVRERELQEGGSSLAGSKGGGRAARLVTRISAARWDAKKQGRGRECRGKQAGALSPGEKAES